MQWIIRGKSLGMREIKDRLNVAFLLYESLIEKFEKGKISFEKCAVSAYITTAFPDNSIIEIMLGNNDFIIRLIQEKAYIDLPEKQRMYFKGIKQSIELIEDAFEYGSEFKIEYFSHIDGFSNREASVRFLDLIEEDEEVLVSDAVYNNT